MDFEKRFEEKRMEWMEYY